MFAALGTHMASSQSFPLAKWTPCGVLLELVMCTYVGQVMFSSGLDFKENCTASTLLLAGKELIIMIIIVHRLSQRNQHFGQTVNFRHTYF